MAPKVEIAADYNRKPIDDLSEQIERLKAQIKSVAPENLRNVKTTKDTATAYDAVVERIQGMNKEELKRARLNKDQIEYVRRYKREWKDQVLSEKQGLKELTKERKEAEKNEDRYNVAKLSKLELYQEKIISQDIENIKSLSQRQKYIEGGVGMTDVAQPSMAGGIAGGIAQGAGLGWLVSKTPQLALAYGAYKLTTSGIQASKEAYSEKAVVQKNMLESARYAELLTGRNDQLEAITREDDAIRKLTVLGKRLGTRNVKETSELDRILIETVGASKENLDLYHAIGEELAITGDTLEQLPQFAELRRRGMTGLKKYVPGYKAFGDIWKSEMSAGAAYREAIYSKGTVISTEQEIGMMQALKSVGITGAKAAEVSVGMGGGAGEAGNALVYRALMRKGIPYLTIKNIIREGRLNEYWETIRQGAISDFGSLTKGSIGLQIWGEKMAPGLTADQWVGAASPKFSKYISGEMAGISDGEEIKQAYAKAAFGKSVLPTDAAYDQNKTNLTTWMGDFVEVIKKASVATMEYAINVTSAKDIIKDINNVAPHLPGTAGSELEQAKQLGLATR